MKKALTMLCICMAGLAFAQTNLVANGDFQTIAPGGINCNLFSTGQSPCANVQGWFEDYWEQAYPWTCPQKKPSPCWDCVASADHYCEGPNNEDVHAFMLNREYICAPLLAPLEPGKQYYIEYYIRSDGPLIDAGIRFSDDRPRQCGYRALNIEGQPHAEIDNNIQFDLYTWTKVSGYYTADDAYDWIIFGTFEHEYEDFEQSFWLDDIRIFEWAPADCPSTLLIENRQYPVINGAVQKAADYLYAGYNVGVPTADGDVIIPVDAFISYKAGEEVGLFDGFGAVFESEFRAYIAPCGTDCVPPDAFAGISQDVCSGQPIQIGGDPIGGYGYGWGSAPVSATQYLSSLSVADPVFSPPPGEGDITYYVTVTNACGQQSTGEVIIHYDDTPSSVAQFTVSNLQLGDEPSFDLLLNSDIKSVNIEVLDAALSTIYYQENYQYPIDFQCCLLQWALPTALSPCIDYKIRITVTNFCTGATAEQVIDWNRNRTFALTAPVPNVITPNNDGINDLFCVSFTGASQISLEVKASSGVTVFYDQVIAYPPMACLWNGECNQGVPACINGPLEDGTYFYILKFFDCSGMSHNDTGFMSLFNGVFRTQQLDEQDTITSLAASGPMVFPNPSSGKIAVVFGASGNAGATVEVCNTLGEEIAQRTTSSSEYMVELDLSFAPPGIYYARCSTEGEMHVVRFVINRND